MTTPTYLVGPTGLVPVQTFTAANWSQKTHTYYIPSGDGNAYYPGDAVLSAANADAYGVPAVIKATVGTETLRGVIVACYTVNPQAGSLVGTTFPPVGILYIPATKAQGYYVQVVDDPMTIFAITDDGLNSADTIAANANKNFSLTIAAPTSPGQISATVLNSASLATTQALNMKAFGLAQFPGNSFGIGCRWLCMINQHELMGNTAGV